MSLRLIDEHEKQDGGRSNQTFSYQQIFSPDSAFVSVENVTPGGFWCRGGGVFEKFLSFISLISPFDTSFWTIYFISGSEPEIMGLRSINLPGIGTKYELETEKNDLIAIFFLKSGNIQMYTLPHDTPKPSVVEFSPGEARRLGTILSGAIMEADRESVEIAFSALSDLRISVHTFVIRKKMAGHSLEDLQVRAKTGVTIIAVSRGDKNVINPPPDFVFQVGDAVVAIGETDQLKKFEREILVE